MLTRIQQSIINILIFQDDSSYTSEGSDILNDSSSGDDGENEQEYDNSVTANTTGNTLNDQNFENDNDESDKDSDYNSDFQVEGDSQSEEQEDDDTDEGENEENVESEIEVVKAGIQKATLGRKSVFRRSQR